MPPKIKITEEAILDAAVRITEEQGIEGLNARSLAKELGCSVQPIFRVYSGMEDLKKAVVAKVAEMYYRYLSDAISLEDDLVGLEMAYIRFAQEKKNLFRLLHMSDRLGLHRTEEFTEEGINREIIEAMARMTGLPLEQARMLYTGAFFTAHGIASMIATNHCSFQEEEIQEIMKNVFEGLVMKLRSGETDTKQMKGRSEKDLH